MENVLTKLEFILTKLEWFFNGAYSIYNEFNIFINFALILILVIVLTLVVGFYILHSKYLYNIAKHEGKENGIIAWIPILNEYLIIDMGNGLKPIFALIILGFIPVIGKVFSIIYYLYISFMRYKIFKRYNVDIFLNLLCSVVSPLSIVALFIINKKIKNKKTLK